MAGVAAAVAAGSTLASAAPRAAEDGGDAFNVAKGTAVSATNSGNVTITAHTGIGTLVVTCTVSNFAGKTGTTLKFNIAPPVFSDGGPPCTDNLGGTNTITTNKVNGTWSVKEKDRASDEGLAEPNATGDKMSITIPKAGLVDSNSLRPGCTVTAAPTAAATMTGTYNDAGTLRIMNASVPVAFSAACQVSASTATFTVTYHLTPAIFDQG